MQDTAAVWLSGCVPWVPSTEAAGMTQRGNWTDLSLTRKPVQYRLSQACPTQESEGWDAQLQTWAPLLPFNHCMKAMTSLHGSSTLWVALQM